MCVADTRAEAEDIAAEVVVEYEELPAVVDMLAAQQPGSVLVHDTVKRNVYLEVGFDGAIEAAAQGAPVRITRELRTARQVMSPIECRGFVAQWDRRLKQLILHGATQFPHVVRTGLSQEYTTRTTFTASYLGRRFVDETDTNSSQALLGGWDYELAPGTRVTLQGGPRVSSYRGIAPEVVAGFFRDTNRLDVGVDYWHGETIVLGIQGPVAVNSGTARLTWPMTRTIEIGSHSAVTGIVTLDQRQVTTYRETLVSSWSPGGWYTVAASYGVDYQQGDIRRNLFSNANVLRHVFRVSVTVAPRLSRAIRSSDDPAARAKGVSQ